MQAKARAAQESCGKQGEIEQGGMCHSHSRKTQLQLRREAMRGHVLMANAFEDFSIRHCRRAGGFTGETTHALGRVKVCPLILRQSSRRFFTPQTQSSAR